jgi:hypothetical protein
MRPYLKNKTKEAEGIAQVVEHLLSSNPRTTKLIK